MLASLKWRHKLLDAFLKGATTPSEISSHVRTLTEDANELGVILQEPIEEATAQLLTEIKRDCSLILKACNVQFKGAESSATLSKNSTNVKLPKLNISSFDGNELSWLSWWDQYSSTIHENPDLTDAVRVQYLATSLTGTAKESTNQFPFVASSYNTIVQYLNTTYGDIVKLRSIYSNAITNMPYDASTDGMRKNLDNLVAYLKRLKKFDPSQKLEHYLGHVLSKFTADIRRSAYLYLDVKELEQNMDNVLKALDCVLKYEEKIRSLLRTINPAQQATEEVHRSNVVLLTPNSTTNTKKRKSRECVFCGQIHSSKNCMQVTTSDARRQVLKDKHLCFKCLGAGHSKPSCPQAAACSHCKKTDHNVALCYNYVNFLGAKKSSSSNDSQPPNKKYKGKGIFLQTFTCYLFHNQEYHELRGVLDSCADRSFINYDILQKHKLSGLSGQEIESSVCSFASDVPHSFASEKIVIRLFNTQRQHRLFEFCSTPIIAPSFQSAPPPAVCREVLPLNYSYADKFLFTLNRPPIDLLIGNDFYNLVVRSANTKVIGENLVILDTFFGYVPSGNLGGEPSPSLAILLNVKPNSIVKTSMKLDEDVNFDNISHMYSLESLGISSKELDNTDELILQEFRTKKSFSDNRIVVSWPWKTANPKLNSNSRIALARLKALFVSTSKEILIEVDKMIKGTTSFKYT